MDLRVPSAARFADALRPVRLPRSGAVGRHFDAGAVEVEAVRVPVHVFLCMLACHAEWHMRQRLAPILFDEEDPDAARARRASPVEPAKPSPSARAKAASISTPDATAVHSFHTLLADLSTVVLNEVSIGDSECFELAAAPTHTQRKAFDLLGVNPRSMFPKAGRLDSAHRVPAKENLRFCAVKFRLNRSFVVSKERGSNIGLRQDGKIRRAHFPENHSIKGISHNPDWGLAIKT